MLKNFKSGYEVSGSSATARNEKNDCVVRAVANSFGISYDQAHKFVADEFKRVKGNATYYTNAKMKKLTQNGYNGLIEFEPQGQLDLFDNDVKRVDVSHLGDEPKRGGKLINKKYKHKPVPYTVKTFAQEYNVGNYFVLVNKHALAINNGVIVDNGDMQFDGYRRVVTSAFQVK